VLQDKRFNVTAQTTFEEFETFVKNEGPTLNIERDNLALIFERVRTSLPFPEIPLTDHLKTDPRKEGQAPS